MNDESRKRDEEVHLPLRVLNWLSANQSETIIRARLLKEGYSEEVITNALTTARKNFTPNKTWKDTPPTRQRQGNTQITMGVIGLGIGIIGSCMLSGEAVTGRGQGNYVVFTGFIAGGLFALWSGFRSARQPDADKVASEPVPDQIIQYQMLKPPAPDAGNKTLLTFLPQTDKFLLSNVELFCNGKLLEKVKKISKDMQPLTYEVEPGTLDIAIKAGVSLGENITSHHLQVQNVQMGHHIQVAWTTLLNKRQLFKNSISGGISSQLGGGILEALFFGRGPDDKSQYDLQLVLANKKSEADIVTTSDA